MIRHFKRTRLIELFKDIKITKNQSRSSILLIVFVFFLIEAVGILWTFDSNFTDSGGTFQGFPINRASLAYPSIDGNNFSLSLVGSLNQSVVIISPIFLDFSNRSFTITVWIKASTFREGNTFENSDNAIFGQHQYPNRSHSLHLVIRQRKVLFGFFADDTSSQQLLSPSTWYHVRESVVFFRLNLNKICGDTFSRLLLFMTWKI